MCILTCFAVICRKKLRLGKPYASHSVSLNTLPSCINNNITTPADTLKRRAADFYIRDPHLWHDYRVKLIRTAIPYCQRFRTLTYSSDKLCRNFYRKQIH